MVELSSYFKINSEISEQELGRRQEMAREVAQLIYLKEWVSEIYLYGSTARGDAKKTSNIDLAVITKDIYFPCGTFCHFRLEIKDILKKYEKTHKGPKFDILLATPYFLSPEGRKAQDTDLFENILKEGSFIEQE